MNTYRDLLEEGRAEERSLVKLERFSAGGDLQMIESGANAIREAGEPADTPTLGGGSGVSSEAW